MPFLILCIVLLCPNFALAKNETISSFSKAKKTLMTDVYYDYRKTLYCNATFSSQKEIDLPYGFTTEKHKKRATKVEWEHVVPAENFGRSFVEWREGDSNCVSSKGKSYKGRRCAQKTNMEYRYMQADLYNLYPAIGAVNASRSNYNFTLLPKTESSFGSCNMIIDGNKVQPPEEAMGVIARTYMYMDWAYEHYSLSKKQQQLVTAWDKMYPVTEWECTRAARIEQIQGNHNPFVGKHCSPAKGENYLSTLLERTTLR